MDTFCADVRTKSCTHGENFHVLMRDVSPQDSSAYSCLTPEQNPLKQKKERLTNVFYNIIQSFDYALLLLAIYFINRSINGFTIMARQKVN